MSDLKSKLIKLGSTNPELRPHIRAILSVDAARLRSLMIAGEQDVQMVDNLPRGLEIYTYTTPRGHFAALAVTSKSRKPFSWHSYRTEGERDRAVAQIIVNWNDGVARKKERKEERKYKGGLNVGDILVASWGYDQTNVDWYQVVGTPSAMMVELREISSKRIGTDKVMGTPDGFIGPVIKKRPQGNGKNLYVKIDSVRNAYLWDGRPKYETPFGMGH